MIVFPSDSLCELRQSMLVKMDSGELTEAEAFRQTLEADPHDPIALGALADIAEKAGDYGEAERLARATIRSHPSGHGPYMVLVRALTGRGADEKLIAGYSVLALEKLSYDADAVEDIDLKRMFPDVRIGDDRKFEFLQTMIDGAAAKQQNEPPAVTAELKPHRLIHGLREAGPEPLEEAFVDDLLAHSAECGPMLLGILKEHGENLIPEEDDAMVLRALALLGEIGHPEYLPPIAEFLDLDDEAFQDIAHWACSRIGFRRPAESLAVLRAAIPKSRIVNRGSLAMTIAMLPAVPGRIEAATSLLTGLENQSKDDQEFLVVSAITCAWTLQGSGSAQAAAWQAQYDHLLSPEARKELKKLRMHGDRRPYVASESHDTIYDLCKTGFDAVQPVVKAPTPGRNDPCWCGSGKKYKKCHLDADQGR